jgi:hypothetical protein
MNNLKKIKILILLIILIIPINIAGTISQGGFIVGYTTSTSTYSNCDNVILGVCAEYDVSQTNTSDCGNLIDGVCIDYLLNSSTTSDCGNLIDGVCIDYDYSITEDNLICDLIQDGICLDYNTTIIIQKNECDACSLCDDPQYLESVGEYSCNQDACDSIGSCSYDYNSDIGSYQCNPDPLICEDTCINNDDICDPSCDETTDNDCLGAVCGTAAREYLYSESDYNGTFCQNGFVNPNNPTFPQTASNTNWNCEVLDAPAGNIVSTVTCEATRQEQPTCLDNDGICDQTSCDNTNDNDCPPCIDEDGLCPQYCDQTNDNDCIKICINDDGICDETKCNNTNDNDCPPCQTGDDYCPLYCTPFNDDDCDFGQSNTIVNVDFEYNTRNLTLECYWVTDTNINITGENYSQEINSLCQNQILTIQDLNEGRYSLTASINQPCINCSEQIFFNVAKPSEEVFVNDTNIFVLVILISLIVFLVKREK